MVCQSCEPKIVLKISIQKMTQEKEQKKFHVHKSYKTPKLFFKRTKTRFKRIESRIPRETASRTRNTSKTHNVQRLKILLRLEILMIGYNDINLCQT